MNEPLFPVLFIGHGSPMNAIEHTIFSAEWAALGRQLPKPDAILCVSAHWLTAGSQVTLSRHPRTIHDFGGFPRELSEVTYPAPGNPDLVNDIIETTGEAVITDDLSWGLDHGCWSVLTHMYPNADVPVVQFSLNEALSAQEHFELAGKLTFLRARKVLILCSGNIVHNLRLLDWSKMNIPEFGYEWATQANKLIVDLISAGKLDELFNYRTLGADVQRAITDPDHFWPVLYALAQKQPDEKIEFFNDKLVMGSLSMTSFIIQ